jgi:hypothetical protein
VEILLGDQDQNMLAGKLLGAVYCAEEACYLSVELGSGEQARVEVKGVPCCSACRALML